LDVTAPDVICLPQCEPHKLLGLQLHLLGRFEYQDAEPVLLLWRFPGEVVLLGRYHLYRGPAERRGITAYRRLTGGRIVNAGDGWLGCSLILPSRAALMGGRDARLRPDQVMNRCVRGAMAALRAMGADCFYPGRDTLTCKGRELAMCSFEQTSSGALLFELFIAVGRGLETLPLAMERFDPDGALTCRFDSPQSCTYLAREIGRAPLFDELADRLETSYAQQFGAAHRRDLNQSETATAEMKASQLTAWLAGRSPDPSLGLIGRQSIQLGWMEARLAAAQERIERVEFYGDFIADSPGLAQFEQNLAGQRLDLMTLTSAALQTYADGTNFILGCGDLTNIARLVLSAQ
jgi:lipoate-protein ligase A